MHGGDGYSRLQQLPRAQACAAVCVLCQPALWGLCTCGPSQWELLPTFPPWSAHLGQLLMHTQQKLRLHGSERTGAQVRASHEALATVRGL